MGKKTYFISRISYFHILLVQNDVFVLSFRNFIIVKLCFRDHILFALVRHVLVSHCFCRLKIFRVSEIKRRAEINSVKTEPKMSF